MPAFWMGDQESLDAVALAEEKVADGQKAGRFLGGLDESDMPPLWEKAGNVGIVHIRGSLVDGSAGWMRLFGVNGYNDIAAAAQAAVADPDVKSLMFNVASGGGHVHGLAEFSENIHRISKLKPSLTYVGSTMASAAYWSGSSVAGPIVMAPTAEVGSLGVLMVTKEYSKQLAAEGVTVEVHRAGEMKARVNPFEELTPEARAHIKTQLDDLHVMFKSAVAKNRPQMSKDDVETSTRGETFLGQRAIKAKLADSIGSFNMALKLLDKNSFKKDTSSNSKGAAMFMTAEQLAQIQAFAMANPTATYAAALEAAGVVLTPEETAEMQAAAAKAATDKAAADQLAADNQKAADDAAAAAKAAGTVDTSALDLLKSQLSVAQAALQASATELGVLKATTQSQAAAHDGLLAIARGAVANMLIPMGGSSASADAMDAATVIAEHARVKPLFLEKFKPGQQSKSAADLSKENQHAIDPQFKARAAAAQAAAAQKAK